MYILNVLISDAYPLTPPIADFLDAVAYPRFLRQHPLERGTGSVSESLDAPPPPLSHSIPLFSPPRSGS